MAIFFIIFLFGGFMFHNDNEVTIVVGENHTREERHEHDGLFTAAERQVIITAEWETMWTWQIVQIKLYKL